MGVPGRAGALGGVLLAVVAAAAILVLLLRRAEPWLIYFPTRDLVATPSAVGLRYEDVWLRAADGTGLHGWYLPGDGPTVLFLHGNAGNISYRLDKLRVLHELGAAVLIIDYRGYGRSEGRPDEAGLYEDARAAYAWLLDRAVPASAIVVYGESLGTAVAVDLAAGRDVAGVILEAVFTSAADVARELYPGVPVHRVLRTRFDTRAKVARLEAPLLVLHSQDDELFAVGHAEAIVTAAGQGGRLVRLRGGHNDAFQVSATVYREALREFLAAARSRR